MLTVYGRKPVLETLQNAALKCHAVHLSSSNREAQIIEEIRQLAGTRGVPIKLHTREALARISKNGKQDQGVAVDIECPAFRQIDDCLGKFESEHLKILALDGISNPQNLGMIIRSATAGNIDGIIVPRKGTAALGPLVIKSSAGTLYRAPLWLCNSLPDALRSCQQAGAQICTLEADSPVSLFEYGDRRPTVYVLGNETEGISSESRALADQRLSIPMRNGVESLNVAVTASLIAFGNYLER